MHQFHAHKVGLVFGGLLALGHAVWALMVLMGFAQPLLNWIMGLHFLNFQYTVAPFAFGNAALLIVMTGIVGYIVGWVFGLLWNWIHGATHTV